MEDERIGQFHATDIGQSRGRLFLLFPSRKIWQILIRLLVTIWTDIVVVAFSKYDGRFEFHALCKHD